METEKKRELSEIIAPARLQEIQDNVSRALDITTIILDASGMPVTRMTNCRGICKLIERRCLSVEPCTATRRQMCFQARDERKIVSMRCPYTGMAGAVVPAFLGDRFLGALIIGQIMLQGESPAIFVEPMEKAGIDHNLAMRLLKDVPTISWYAFELIKNCLQAVVDTIVKLAANELEMIGKNERLLSLSEELNRLAFYDRITGLPNRERMERDVEHDLEYEFIIVVRIEDIGRVTQVFDRDSVNALLREVRDFLLALRIPHATLYRGTISHYAFLLKNTNGDIHIPIEAAERIRDRCKRAWEIHYDGQSRSVFAYLSVCVLPINPQTYKTFDSLIAAVDHSFEMAKRTEGVVIYGDAAREKFDTRLKLEISLKKAVRTDMKGFYLVYQPIVDADTAMWRGVEALCRWSCSDIGAVPPGVFIPAAEACGLIGEIGIWVLEQAIAQIKAWGLDQIDGFFLEVNLSPVQLSLPELDKIVMQILSKHNYPPEKFGVEITESSEFNFSEDSIQTIVRLSQLGVGIILDDFGMGYSSFNMLHKLPVKYLKMDRTFIAGIESDQHLQHLLQTMVTLAHNSDMKLIAEGVENRYQAEFLLSNGADYFQGFFFSRPLTAGELTKNLNHFCGREEDRSPEDHGLSPTLRGVLNRYMRNLLTDELEAEAKIRESILDNISAAVYVTDLESSKILYANQELQRLYGGNLVKRRCWEALQNNSERCEFCPIIYLLKNPGKSYQWETYNAKLGKHFRIRDSIIPWTGGKLAHLECAVEIESPVS